MLRKTLLTLLSALALASAAHAEDAQTDAQAKAQAEALVGSLHFRSGDIALNEAKATFHLGQGYRYLDQADARRVVEDLWGNPSDDSVLGLIVPAGESLIADDGWAVVVTYSDDGHVDDDDAKDTDYDELLTSMKKEAEEENDDRRKAGYAPLHIVRWAAPPRYDMTSKKLYWARELASDGNPEHTLNYDIRVLGRNGYLSLNAVSRMSELGRVQSGMQDLLPLTEFNPGARYADFNSSTDKLAGYGVAALIAGGIAAKTGLFAKIGLLLLGLKKFVIFIFAGIAAFVRKLFGRKDR